MSLDNFIEIYGLSDHTLKADGFDDCIVGMDSKQRLVYDVDGIIEQLVTDDGMTHKDAEEYFYYNIEGSHMGDYTPIYIHSFKRGKSPKKPLMTLGCEEIVAECKHLNINYQPEEKETNSTEYRYCEDCGEELPSDSS